MKSIDNSLKYKLGLMFAHRDILRNHVAFITKWYISYFRRKQLDAARRLKVKLQNSEQINVAFMLNVAGMWKCDYLFKAMQRDDRFHPYVVVFPYSRFKGFEDSEIELTLKRTEDFIIDKGYEYVIPKDKRGCWQDIKKTLNPDILFFSNPYKDVSPQYFVYHYIDRLTCYIPYSVTLFKTYSGNYDRIFHNLVGMYFVETELHRELAASHSRNHAENVVVSGYPGTEIFLHNDYHPRDVWKRQINSITGERKKRVIWAPHHTIDEEYDLQLSTFLIYADDMVRLAKKYHDSIQFVFKPHQLLKFKLDDMWGRERADAYYREWNTMDNTQLEETSYIDLFLTSDAMLHDSGSFTFEYLYTGKPVAFMLRNHRIRETFSPYGVLSFDRHYQIRNVGDIDRFLQEVVLDNKDPMKKGREEFYEKYIMQKNGLLPSQNIIKQIEKIILDK